MNIFNKHFLHYRTLDRDIRRKIEEHCHSGSLVMDAGCGIGRYKVFFDEYQYLGCDISPIGYKTHRFDLCRPKKMPEEWEGAFDFVLCSQVLEHVPTLELAFESLVKMTKPGGIIVVTIPFMWELHGEPFDYRRLTKWELTKMAGNDLCILDLRSQTGTFASLVQLFINFSTSLPAPFRWIAKASVPFLNIFGLWGELFSSDKMTLNYIVVYKKL